MPPFKTVFVWTRSQLPGTHQLSAVHLLEAMLEHGAIDLAKKF